MSQIGSTLQVNDRMSGPLNNIANNLSRVISNFERMQNISSKAVNTADLGAANSAVTNMASNVNNVSDNINRASSNMYEFSDVMIDGQVGAGGLLNKIKGILATVASVYGFMKLINASDTFTSNAARLDLMNDGLQTTAELQEKIYQSAQRSRANYTDMVGTVSKLGIVAEKAFKSNDEMVRFSELMNKNFIVGGASATEQTAAMYQLTQAMASGRLQGDEYRSIIENAPLLAKSIEDYMIKVEGTKGSMKEWASEGMLTADVIKNALFNSADEVEERFKKIPITFGQLWTSFKNKANMELQPVYERISEIANSEEFQEGMNVLAEAVGMLANVLVTVLDIATQVANYISENWSTVGPIIEGVTTAVLALAAAFAIVNTVSSVISLLTNPLAWIVLAIVAIIVVIFLVVDAVNQATGSSISALGIIVGSISTVGAVIYNIFLALINFVIDLFVVLWNFIGVFVNFLGNVFRDPIGSIARLFFGLVDTVLGLLETLANAIDWIFGSNLGGAVSGWRNSLDGWVDDTFGKGNEIMAKVNAEDWHVGERIGYEDAYNSGYDVGKGIGNGISSLADQAKGLYNGLLNGPGGTSLPADTAETAKNTGSMADSLDVTSEDLKYLRDIAEKEIVNKFTTAEIKIDMINNNNINSELDLDGIIDGLADKCIEEMNISGEGAR